MVTKSLILAATLAASTPAGAETVVNAGDTVRLGELVVEGVAKTDVKLLPLNVTEIGRHDIDRTTSSTLLPTLARHVPGLFVTERGVSGYGVSGGSAGAVNIRGVGQGNRVLFLIDGQPQWAGLFGHSLPDTYVANGIERVEVVKGPSSLLYGSNAMGGSVNLITRRQTADGLSGRARAMFGSYSTQRFDLGAGYRKGKAAVTAGAHLDRTNGYRRNSAFWEADGFARAEYNPTSHWQAAAGVHLTRSKADNPGTIQAPLLDMWTDISRGTASVAVKNRYAVAEGGVQAALNWGRHKVDDGHAPGTAPRDYIFHSADRNIGVSLFQTLRLWQDNALSLGVDFQHWGGRAWNTGKETGDDTAIGHHTANEVAGYVMMQQSLLRDLLTLNAGVRLQHGSAYGNIWVPQAGLIVRPYKGASVKLSYGKGFRAPNIRELYLYPPHNPDLRPEYMYSYEAELRQHLSPARLDLGLALYYIDGRNLIQTVMRDGRPLNVNTGAFVNKGIEFDASWHPADAWSLTAGYSYLHTDNRDLTGAPRHKLDATLDFTPGALSVTLGSTSVWGLRTGAADRHMENYSLLNLRAAYTVRAHVRLTPFISMENITACRYEIVAGCPMPGFTIYGGAEINF